DGGGRITIPGFYDPVRHWDAQERAYMRKVGPSDARMLRDASATKPWGESGYSLYERTTIRPSLTVSGVVGGYQGPGVKAAIPTCAVAKLNWCRIKTRVKSTSCFVTMSHGSHPLACARVLGH